MEQSLSLYKIFYSVAKNLNISHASKELFISQPAISKSIKKLEENLNTKLFIRNSRGVTLTNEGNILYDYVKTAFSSIKAGEDQLRKINDLGIGNIRLGVSSTLCKYIMLEYLKEFIEANPHIKISISCQSTNQTLKMIEENKVDVGLIGRPSLLKNIDFFPIEEIEDVFVASKSYIENLKIRDDSSNIFNSAALMLLDKDNMTRQYIDDYLSVNHIEINDVIEVSNMELLIEFAKIGMGISCVIKEFIKNELENKILVQIPLGIPIHKREIGFAYNKSAVLTEAAKKFVGFYKESSFV